jgi:hypothetical protein
MKLFPLLMFMLALQVSIMIFENPSVPTTSSGDQIPLPSSGVFYNQSVYTNGTQAFNFTEPQTGGITTLYADPSSVWSAIANPFKGGSTVLYAFLAALALYVFGIGLFASRNEMVYLAPLFALFLGVGFIPCWNLWHVIAKDLSPIICGTTSASDICGWSGLAGLVVAGPLYFLWFMSCLEYWTARQLA